MATGTIILPIIGAALDGTNPPGIDYSQSRPKLLFDDSTDEIVRWVFRVPGDYSSSPVAKIQYSMASATANEVIFDVAFMAVSDGDAQDLDTDSFDTVNASAATTVPGTAGHLDEISITCSNDDSVAAGDWLCVRLSRDADNVGDDATGDAEVWAFSLEYTTT